MGNKGFNGTSATWDPTGAGNTATGFGPLSNVSTDDSPAEVQTTGAGSANHTFLTGLSNVTTTVDFVGTPLAGDGTTEIHAGDIGALLVTWFEAAGTAGSLANALLTRISLSGSIDQSITGSITVRPSKTATAGAGGSVVGSGEVPFNGTTLSFDGNAQTPLNSVTAEEVVAEVQASGAADSGHVYLGGIPMTTTTWEVVGETTLAKDDTGVLVVSWAGSADKGIGDIASGIITKVETTGGIDSPIMSTITCKQAA